MKKYNCYICDNSRKFYETAERPTGDDVARFGEIPNLYHYRYKTGFFSSSFNTIYICRDSQTKRTKGCSTLIDDVFKEYCKNKGLSILTRWEDSKGEKINGLYGCFFTKEGQKCIDANKATFTMKIKEFDEKRALQKIKKQNEILKVNERKDILELRLEKSKKIESERIKQNLKKEITRVNYLKSGIKNLLKDYKTKMPASDIDGFLKHQDVDEIKEFCEDMYHNGEISRTANYRYFILSEEKKKPKKSSAPKSEAVDVEKELEKLKGLLDKGLITQEQYDAKSNELLGL